MPLFVSFLQSPNLFGKKKEVPGEVRSQSLDLGKTETSRVNRTHQTNWSESTDRAEGGDGGHGETANKPRKGRKICIWCQNPSKQPACTVALQGGNGAFCSTNCYEKFKKRRQTVRRCPNCNRSSPLTPPTASLEGDGRVRSMTDTNDAWFCSGECRWSFSFNCAAYPQRGSTGHHHYRESQQQQQQQRQRQGAVAGDLTTTRRHSDSSFAELNKGACRQTVRAPPPPQASASSAEQRLESSENLDAVGVFGELEL